MQTDEFWINGADVIISGPDVPGEGEHKVMDFLREAKEEKVYSKELYQPDHTHVLYGVSWKNGCRFRFERRRNLSLISLMRHIIPHSLFFLLNSSMLT